MSIETSGTTITKVVVNGVAMNTVVCNGVTVWTANRSLVASDFTFFPSTDTNIGWANTDGISITGGTDINLSWNVTGVVASGGFRTGLINFGLYKTVRAQVVSMNFGGTTTNYQYEHFQFGLSPNLDVTNNGNTNCYKVLSPLKVIYKGTNSTGLTGTYDIDVSSVTGNQYLIFQWGTNIVSTKTATIRVTLIG